MSAAERLVWYCMIFTEINKKSIQENRGRVLHADWCSRMAQEGRRNTRVCQHGCQPVATPCQRNHSRQNSRSCWPCCSPLTSQQSPAPRHQYIYRQLHGGVQLTLR